MAAFRKEIEQEIEGFLARVWRDQDRGHLDLEAVELALRSSMHQIGGVLLEKLLNSDEGGYGGTWIQCGQGHAAEFVEYRRKEILTVLSKVAVERAYYYCAVCAGGVIPKDQELDIVGTCFSPGVRRLMGRVGGKDSFAEGRKDLEELAGIMVKTKSVERVSEALGGQIECNSQRERELALSGKLVSFPPVPFLYLALDGTGVPVVARETEGRKGKDPTGKAKTREAKLGCVFIQTKVDDEGYPVRDPESTTYVGAIETAEEFGRRIYGEAVRRGVNRAAKVIVLGDGAHWIWGIAEEHFPGATHIVDLYHAREHLAELAKIVYELGSLRWKQWLAARIEELDAGQVEAVALSLRRLRPQDRTVKDQTDKAIDYFQTNCQRMRYADFRRQGLFVGSGVIEAGCKTIIGQRLKRSGMHWTVRGANAIIALRCCRMSGRWEEFWENRSAKTS
jgi:hypothetical protein